MRTTSAPPYEHWHITCGQHEGGRMRKGAGIMNLHWLLWGTLTMLIVAAEGALIIQNGRRKR